MKKYFLTMAVMAIFAVGFAASDEEESTSTQTEQSKETEAQRKAREKQEKIKRVKENGKYWGDIAGQGSMRREYATGEYMKQRFMGAFGTPSNDEDYKLFEMFKKEYIEAYDKAVEAKSRM